MAVEPALDLSLGNSADQSIELVAVAQEYLAGGAARHAVLTGSDRFFLPQFGHVTIEADKTIPQDD